MALFETPRAQSPLAALTETPARAINTLVGRFHAWNEAHRIRESLRGMTAREMDDVGLTRADVDRLIDQTRG